MVSRKRVLCVNCYFAEIVGVIHLSGFQVGNDVLDHTEVCLIFLLNFRKRCVLSA